MNLNVDRLPFPSRIFRGPNALQYLGEFCKTQGERVFILGGNTALNKTKETIQEQLAQAGLQAVAIEWYGGECSKPNIHRLAGEALRHKANVILAVGGGKALDTGKAVAAECRLPVITVPTIAATCAAVTPLSVLYNDKGEFAGNLFLEDCPVGTIIDTAVIIEAPVVWLEAGMGDTLAKLYELRAAASKMTPTSLTISAVSNGQICYDIIKQFGHEARKAAQTKKASQEFDSIVDSIILSAGLSSVFGGEKLRNAAAHAIYNGFTVIPATHEVAHGLIVGYGNLCLLALEGRADNEIIDELRLAYSCGIPTALSQIANMSEAELHTAAEASASAKAMNCMPFPVTADMVIDAIRRVDKLSAKCGLQST